jgi:hypothetical protein
VEHTERQRGVKWGWRRLVGANPVVDGDLRCSGLGKRRRGGEVEAAACSDLAKSSRWGCEVKGSAQWRWEPG